MDFSNTSNFLPPHTGESRLGDDSAWFCRMTTGAASRGKARLGDDDDDTIMQGTTPARIESMSPVIDWKDTIPPEDRQVIFTQEFIPPVRDDFQDLGDPQFVAEYVNPIFINMNGVEQKYRQANDYMQRTQNDITQRMRAVLIDWLVEVHWKFKLPSSFALNEPLLMIFDDFLTAEECDRIVKLSLKQSEGTVFTNKLRIALPAKESEKIVSEDAEFLGKLEERIGEVCQCPPHDGEVPLVAMLTPPSKRPSDGVEKRLHLGLHVDTNGNRPFRFCTAIIYLSDVEEGGETVFPVYKLNHDKYPFPQV
ncbi:cyclin a, putative [Perkinsus marinus ATCC 50983]|uniref:Cyclin a, putative n=1 Tax=Perkinsus marinus (strain ATCC 50983 / TXsc) TaxID=423536 RepID=C5KUQ7_PERM5|nr:cyclin a, putative [Perkinsus marinus ATCC 50983]EER11778.1 cyclin a, putative [Perkinsus marinus ATCC 50983]|eukprot:XP_002779983.1 cyclin a, putative [Perkinsus marinus ATCC 50983]